MRLYSLYLSETIYLLVTQKKKCIFVYLKVKVKLILKVFSLGREKGAGPLGAGSLKVDLVYLSRRTIYGVEMFNWTG